MVIISFLYSRHKVSLSCYELCLFLPIDIRRVLYLQREVIQYNCCQYRRMIFQIRHTKYEYWIMRRIPSGLWNDDNIPSSDSGPIDLSSSSIITLAATNKVSLWDSYVYDFETSSFIGSRIDYSRRPDCKLYILWGGSSPLKSVTEGKVLKIFSICGTVFNKHGLR